MILAQPKARLIAAPEINWAAVQAYLEEVGGLSWYQARSGFDPAGENLTEFAGRECYRSWEPGLNPNVTKVRDDRSDYLDNLLSSYHGSVLEHANYTFQFSQVSRVLTHELVRHRAGTAVSQESMRYVRFDSIPFWVPDWVEDDEELSKLVVSAISAYEAVQSAMLNHFKPDTMSFAQKKKATSFMRRFLPNGVATDLVWTANIRTLRHVIEVRTAAGAEEEIRGVFGQVAEIMQQEAPLLFGDFVKTVAGEWVPAYRKV